MVALYKNSNEIIRGDIMKNILIILIMFSSFTVYSQNIMQDLDSPEIGDRINALDYIKQENLTQYIPEIESRLFLQENLQYQFFFLNALNKLGDPDFQNYAVQYIQNAPTFTGEDYLESQVNAVRLLFNNDNYTYSNLVMEYIGRHNTRSDFNAAMMLPYIAINVPEYEQQAVDELKRILFTSPDTNLRASAVNDLEKCKAVSVEDMYKVFENDQNRNVRLQALTQLTKLNYPDLRDLAINSISTEEDSLLRTEYVDILLKKSGLPEDVHFLEVYRQTETNEFVSNFIYAEIHTYIPPVLPMNTPATTMINTLISYTTDIFNYGWITTQTKYSSYMDSLNEISKLILRNLYNEAVSRIDTMLNQVEFDFNQTPVLAFEGYNFLHFHLLNIKDKLLL